MPVSLQNSVYAAPTRLAFGWPEASATSWGSGPSGEGPSEAQSQSRRLLSSAAAGGFGIYVHWPFCVSKCPYCDFNSHVRETIDQEAWLQAFLTELDHVFPMVRGRTVDSIFFGGGTPSLMPPEVTGAIIDKISALWPVSPDVEITLEANPSSVEAKRFQDFRLAGVNRTSLGVQSFHDESLKFLGRAHSAAEALEAIEVARQAFPRISFDLIYALPDQTTDHWRKDLERAVTLAADHLSVYQLTIEQNTGFYSMVKRGQFQMPEDDHQAELYELTQLYLGAHDLPAYEISNHARPGAESRHNMIYWQGGEWVGIGPGAHGRLNTSNGRLATRQLRKPERWLEAVTNDGHGTEATEVVEPFAQAEELLMMGLRLSEGIRINDLPARTGLALDDIVDKTALEDMIDDGFLWRKRGKIGTTISGRLILNSVIGALLAG